eukprot:CAMPEP_0168452148 /NCGR_PEP_ID=MMETSP0228-20121227/48999_1 /TAXON_ID=133427 /ORGANISM="Protoceratium reticulatum, Strain CCCM 535 (=CCMP 1889)" /LENGTH=77 /DNA_ID=CAMNT_0008466781 /DNA_START=29 /DNA_END=262 /DNA_ORIENTATION=-
MQGDQCSEIRTKVFRMGAPLLRSTIPVALSMPKQDAALKARLAREGDPGSDVETVLSISDVEVEEQGALSVTLDFPC